MKGIKDETTTYTVQGITATFDELYTRFGLVDRKTALRRLNQNEWPIEKALTKPSPSNGANVTPCHVCYIVLYCAAKSCEHCGSLTPYGEREQLKKLVADSYV